MRKDIKDISVTRADNVMVGQERLGLSPFGMLSQLFHQQILQRTQLMVGDYPQLPLALLEEWEEEEQPVADKAPELHLEVEVNVTVEPPEKRERESTGQRPVAQVQARLLERVRQLQRELRTSRETTHRMIPQLGARRQERYHWADGQGLAVEPDRRATDAVQVLAKARLGSGAGYLGAEGVAGVLRPMAQAKTLPLTAAATAALAQGGWTPQIQQLHPGYPVAGARGQSGGSRAGSILLPDALRQRRRGVLERQGRGGQLAGAEDPALEWLALDGESDSSTQLVRRVEAAVRRTLEENQARRAGAQGRWSVPDEQRLADPGANHLDGSAPEKRNVPAGDALEEHPSSTSPQGQAASGGTASPRRESAGEGAWDGTGGDTLPDGVERFRKGGDATRTAGIPPEGGASWSGAELAYRTQQGVDQSAPSPNSQWERSASPADHRPGSPGPMPQREAAQPSTLGQKERAASQHMGRTADGADRAGAVHRSQGNGEIGKAREGSAELPDQSGIEGTGEGPGSRLAIPSLGAGEERQELSMTHRQARESTHEAEPSRWHRGRAQAPTQAEGGAVRSGTPPSTEAKAPAAMPDGGMEPPDGPARPGRAYGRREDGPMTAVPLEKMPWVQEEEPLIYRSPERVEADSSVKTGPESPAAALAERQAELTQRRSGGESFLQPGAALAGALIAPWRGPADPKPIKGGLASRADGEGRPAGRAAEDRRMWRPVSGAVLPPPGVLGEQAQWGPLPLQLAQEAGELTARATDIPRDRQTWAGLPELTFARPPWERQEERQEQAQVEPPKSEYWKNLPQWARKLLEKPAVPTGGAGSAAWQAAQRGMPGEIPGVPPGAAALAGDAASGGMVQWTAPGARLAGADVTTQSAAIQYRERAEREQQHPRKDPGMSEMEVQRTADKVYRIIEERLRRELRRSGR